MKKLSLIALTVVALILSACLPGTSQVATPTSPIIVQPTGASAATQPPTVFVTATQPAVPTVGITPVIEESTPTPEIMQPAPTQEYSMYLIALNDGGQSGDQIGCGDSVVPVTVDVPQGEPSPIRYVIEKMISLKDEYYGQSGLYNVFHSADLQVDSYEIESGVATLNLSGQLLLGGVCDDPRVQAQLEETILQDPNVQVAQIFLNGIPLKDALSEK